MNPKILTLDSPLAEFAKRRILEIAASSLPGEERMDALVDQLCFELDESWNPKTDKGERRADFVIYEILPPLVRFFAQQIFDKMRAAGEV